MALSIRNDPQALMNALAQEFDVVGAADVQAFLERDPSTTTLLGEIRGAIRRYFGKDEVGLKVFRDPEWEDEYPELYVYVRTHLGPKDALERLDRFDDEWWTAKHSSIDIPIIVSLHLFERV